MAITVKESYSCVCGAAWVNTYTLQNGTPEHADSMDWEQKTDEVTGDPFYLAIREDSQCPGDHPTPEEDKENSIASLEWFFEA